MLAVHPEIETDGCLWLFIADSVKFSRPPPREPAAEVELNGPFKTGTPLQNLMRQHLAGSQELNKLLAGDLVRLRDELAKLNNFVENPQAPKTSVSAKPKAGKTSR